MMYENIFKKALSKDELKYDQYGDVVMSRVRGDRDVRGANLTAFADTEILYSFNTKKDVYWVPKLSGFRLRLNFTYYVGGAITLLNHYQNIAIPYNVMACMLSICELRKNQKPIETFNNFVPQVDTLLKRMSTDASYKNHLLKDAHYFDSNFSNRCKILSIDGDVEEEIEKLSRTELGIAATTTITTVARTGVITFAVAVPTLANIFKIGDIVLVGNSTGNVFADVGHSLQGGVVIAIGAATLTVKEITNYPYFTADAGGGAALRPLYRIRTMARQSTSVEIMWQPEFDLLKEDVLYPGHYEFMIKPLPLAELRNNIVESFANVGFIDSSAPGAGTGINVSVDSLHYMLATIKGPPIEDIHYYMRKRYIQCKVDSLANNAITTNTEVSSHFKIPKGTRSLVIAFQTRQDLNGTINSPSLFKGAKTRLNATNGGATHRDIEQFILSIYIEVNQKVYPSYKEFTKRQFVATGDTDYLSYVWYNNQLQLGAGSIGKASESYKEWLNAGPYYYFNLMPDASQDSRDCEVYYTFSQNWDENVRLLLFVIQDELYEEKMSGGKSVYVKTIKV